MCIVQQVMRFGYIGGFGRNRLLVQKKKQNKKKNTGSSFNKLQFDWIEADEINTNSEQSHFYCQKFFHKQFVKPIFCLQAPQTQ